LTTEELTCPIENPRDISPAVSLTDPHDPAIRAELDHITKKIRTVATARRKEWWVR
jgi:hypothetical protein